MHRRQARLSVGPPGARHDEARRYLLLRKRAGLRQKASHMEIGVPQGSTMPHATTTCGEKRPGPAAQHGTAGSRVSATAEYGFTESSGWLGNRRRRAPADRNQLCTALLAQRGHKLGELRAVLVCLMVHDSATRNVRRGGGRLRPRRPAVGSPNGDGNYRGSPFRVTAPRPCSPISCMGTSVPVPGTGDLL
jgi:hypothetical protein